MRQWIDSQNRMMTDEQLLRHIAHFGSLGSVLEHGDVSLLSDSESGKADKTGNLQSPSPRKAVSGKRSLSFYLNGE